MSQLDQLHFLSHRSAGDNEFVVHKFGYSDNLTVASAALPIWDQGSTYYYPSVAVTLGVSSSNVSDVRALAGAWSVEIQGLDSDWAVVSETISLNGRTKVETSNQYIRVFRAYVKTAGADGGAIGNIYIYDTSSAVVAGVPSDLKKVLAKVRPIYNQTEMAIYTIPAGYTGLLHSFWGAATVPTNRYGRFDIFQRPYGGVFRNLFIIGFDTSGGGLWTRNPYFPIALPAKTDIDIRGTVNNVTGTAMAAGFDIHLVKD